MLKGKNGITKKGYSIYSEVLWLQIENISSKIILAFNVNIFLFIILGMTYY